MLRRLVRSGIVPLFVLTFVWSIAGTGSADIFTYLDESDYLTDLSALTLNAVQEGFEDDSVWGTARFPATASSITSQGVTWTSNNAISQVTTSSGAALSGSWGLFSYPHGDFSGPDHSDDIPDGFRGTSTTTLYAIGGWIRTGTPFAGISLSLDSAPVDFGELPGGGDPTVIGTTAKFFGVIDTSGFSEFLWQETEGTFDDQKFIFADDFTFAIPEPSTMAITVILGLCGVVLVGRRRLKGRR